MAYSYNYTSRGSSSMMNELKLKEKDLPLDTVSCIVWDMSRNDPMFAASSWDGCVRIYTIAGTEINKAYEVYLHHPVVCLDFADNQVLLAGLASGDVVAIDPQTGNIAGLGTHDGPICGIYWIRERGCLITLGFDHFIRVWALQNGNALQGEFKLPLKTVTCNFDFPYLLIGSAETTFCIINFKNLPNVNIPRADQYHRQILERFSKYASCKINSQAGGAMLGTIDGRVLIFNFKQGYSGGIDITNPFVTRVQKRTDGKGASLYGQVNSVDLGFHNYESYSVVAGTEDISIFNNVKKTKSKSIATSSATIGAGTACRISPKNEYIAFATGCDWGKGLYQLDNIKRPRITVIKLSNTDLNDYISK